MNKQALTTTKSMNKIMKLDTRVGKGEGSSSN